MVNVLAYLFFQKAASHGLLSVDDRNVVQYGAIPYELTHRPGEAATWIRPLTSMFMHGGILHLAGNMLFLWIFGNNVEDAMGRLRFALFYVAGGLAAVALQTLADPNSTAPLIGASGAIAAVLGGYILLYPRARVLTAIFVIFVFFVELPAAVILALWFLEQLAFGAAKLSNPLGSGGGGVAYFAHVGGFVFGLLTIRLLARTRNPNYRPGRAAVV